MIENQIQLHQHIIIRYCYSNFVTSHFKPLPRCASHLMHDRSPIMHHNVSPYEPGKDPWTVMWTCYSSKRWLRETCLMWSRHYSTPHCRSKILNIGLLLTEAGSKQHRWLDGMTLSCMLPCRECVQELFAGWWVQDWSPYSSTTRAHKQKETERRSNK